MEIYSSRCALYFPVNFLALIYFKDHLQHINDLSPPGAVSLTAQEPTFVTSLHWLHSGDDAGCLLATYLYQGIMWVNKLSFLTFAK
jgi:hypothetical protein